MQKNHRPVHATPARLPESFAPPSVGPADRSWLDPSQAGALVRRRWPSFLAGFGAVFAGVAMLTWALPETYVSSASFLVEQRSPTGVTPALEMLERVGSGRGTETEIELIRSRGVLAPVVEELGLHVELDADGDRRSTAERAAAFRAAPEARPGEYLLGTGPDGGLALADAETGERLGSALPGAPLAAAGLTFTAAGEAGEETRVRVIPFLHAVERVQERLAVSTVNPSADLIGVSCEGRSPEEAQRLCASISASYLRLRSSLQREEANAAATFLTDQVEQVRERLTAAEDRMRAYERTNRTVALDDRATEGVRQFAELRAQREQLDAERSALREWIAGIEAEGDAAGRFANLAAFPTFLRDQNQLVTQLANSLVELENERSRLVVAHTARAPEVAAVDARIGEIERQLQGLAASYERGLETQVAALDRSLARSGSELAEIPAHQVEAARLRREVSLLEELYRFLETRLHEAEVARAVNLPSVRVIDEASLPFEASWPSVPLNLGLGLFLGLVSGTMAAVYREHTDLRLRERFDVEREAGLPVLGMVPHLRRPGPVVAIGGAGADSGVPLPALAAGPEQEVALEAFRSVLADLRFSMQRAGRELRCVAVTSASRGEGKTFTACNLAIACAAHGGRAVVVDTDVRASGVARFFGLPARLPGLTDVLLGEKSEEEVLERFEVADGGTVTVVPAGQATTRGAALLDGGGLGELLSRLGREQGLVVVDTPPLNVLTDAAMVAPHVDAVLVVVRGGITERDALRLTLNRLSRAHGRVVGVVLNDSRLPGHYTSYSHAI